MPTSDGWEARWFLQEWHNRPSECPEHHMRQSDVWDMIEYHNRRMAGVLAIAPYAVTRFV